MCSREVRYPTTAAEQQCDPIHHVGARLKLVSRDEGAGLLDRCRLRSINRGMPIGGKYVHVWID
jgi:hypothetical protein